MTRPISAILFAVIPTVSVAGRLGTGLVLALASLFLISTAPANQTFLSTDDYINALGQISATKDSNVLRAQAVFGRLTQVTDRISGSHIRLVVVDSDTRPWAIAVPDGGIILSKGALAFCYKDEPEIGDTRLAFVLGHELSHLTAGDFWHQSVQLEFANRPDTKDVDRIRETLARAAGVSSDADVNDFLVRLRERELVADDSGFLIAAIAGYDVAKLVEDDENNFLHAWINETGGYSDISHFSATERTAFLRQRLTRLRGRSLLFDVAVRLGFSGFTSEAIRLLHEFEQDFPSKQVFNNLGYFYLNSGIEAMPESYGTKWWFPVIATMDVPTSLQTRSVGGIGVDATNFLEKARKYLELAVQADSEYVTALLNLASTEYFLGNAHAARAHIENVLKLEPNNLDASGVQAPLLVAQNPQIDMSQPALSLLEPLAQGDNPGQSILFNYARLLDQTGDGDSAAKVWNRLATSERGLPGIFDKVVCERLEQPVGCSYVRQNTTDADLYEVVSNYLGASTKDEAVQQLLKEWTRQSYPTDVGLIEIFKDPRGDLVVARDATVIFISVPNQGQSRSRMMVSDLGAPRFEMPLASGIMRNYSDRMSVFSDGPLIREYWYSTEDR